MLGLFELETYWLESSLSRLQHALLMIVRTLCYAFLAHTVFAYTSNLVQVLDALPLEGLAGACELADSGYSFLRNLAYTPITADNCAALSQGGALYPIGGDPVVTDAAGLAELKTLYAVDVEDALTWLCVVLLIAWVIQAQNRGVTAGPAISIANGLTIALYCVLVGNAVFWAVKGHWVYAWDELLWIGGFAAIEMNLSDWRHDIRDAAVT